MTLKECTALLTPLVLALRADVDAPTFRAYHRVLRGVPLALLERACDRLAVEPERKFFPTAPEILGAAEACRREILTAHPFTGCIECDMQIGWRTIRNEAGSERVERCPCVSRHQERLEALGVTRTALASLPAARVELEDAREYVTPEQVDPAIRERLDALAAKLGMR